MAAGQISTKATIALLGASVEVSTHLHMLPEINCLALTYVKAVTLGEISKFWCCVSNFNQQNDFILKDGLDCGHTDYLLMLNVYYLNVHLCVCMC